MVSAGSASEVFSLLRFTFPRIVKEGWKIPFA